MAIKNVLPPFTDKKAQNNNLGVVCSAIRMSHQSCRRLTVTDMYFMDFLCCAFAISVQLSTNGSVAIYSTTLGTKLGNFPKGLSIDCNESVRNDKCQHPIFIHIFKDMYA